MCLRIGTGAGWPGDDEKKRLALVETGAPVVFGVNGCAFVAMPADFVCSLFTAAASAEDGS